MYVFLFCTFIGCKKDHKYLFEYSEGDVTFHICGNEDLLSTYDITLTYFPAATDGIQEKMLLPCEKKIENVQFPFSDSIKFKCTLKRDYPKKELYDIVMDCYLIIDYHNELSVRTFTKKSDPCIIFSGSAPNYFDLTMKYKILTYETNY